MATTPPMRTAIHTPPTPLHGARHDSYQPYSSRKSTRHLLQRNQRAAQTPPPQPSNSESRFLSAPISKSGSTEHQVAHTYSPPSSTHTSPENKLLGSKKVKKSKYYNRITSLDLPCDSAQINPFQGPNISLSSKLPPTDISANMLPTPAKTPRKKIVPNPAIAPTARVLFPVQTEIAEGAMLTPRKRGRKRRQVGFVLDSSMEDEDIHPEDKIQIFTDSKEKVPELDPSEDNPFYDNSDRMKLLNEPPKIRGVRKRKATDSVTANKEVEEAFKREEGMVYVFRGKKIYRKFADDSDQEVQNSFALERDNVDFDAEPSPRLRPLTRSSIKPRLLFPINPQSHGRSISNKEDEEAITDIEEVQSVPNDSEMTDLAPDTEEEASVTPVKTSFAGPATPPMTGYATRAATKKSLDSSSPIGPEPIELAGSLQRKLGKKLSPFDGWQQTKATRKRGSDVLEKDIGGNKRIKENNF